MFRITLFRFISFVICRCFYRQRVSFKCILDKTQSYIFVSNFSSLADSLFIFSALKRKIKFIYRKGAFTPSFFYRFFHSEMFIDKCADFDVNGHKEYVNEVKKLIKGGYSLCFFPENKVSKNGLIGKFYDEIIDIVSNEINISVVPLYVGPLWGTIFSSKRLNTTLKIRTINVFIGLECLPETKPWQLRNMVCELASDSEMYLRFGEKVLHYQFLKLAKKNPFKKLLYELDSKPLGRFNILLKSVILSRKIRDIKRKNNHIGIMLPNSYAAAISILAVIYADCIPAMLNFSLSKTTLASLIISYDLDLVLTSRKFIEKIKHEKLSEMIFLEDIVNEISWKDKIASALILFALPAFVSIRIFSPKSFRNLYEAAIIIFTSGSTGDPNGVVLTHHNVNCNATICCETMFIELDNDAITGNLPLFHSYGMMVEFWIPFMTGIKVTYIRNPLDYEAILKAVREHRLTLLATTQTFLYGYIKKSSNGDFKSLRLLILGAEKFNSANADKIRSLINTEPIEGYGCTELSPVVSINISDDSYHLGKKSGKKGSIGKAITGVAAKIVNIETHLDCQPDEDGLLLIKGPTVMKEYLNNQEDTAKAFIDGWYNTKDIAQIDEEGNITISGRISRFSKIAGEMVSHELIESLINNYLGLFEKSIAVVNLKSNDEKDKIGVFYSLENLNIREITQYLSNFGLSNLWIPKNRDFIRVYEIPTLPSGKLDLKKLKEMAASLSSGH